MQKRLEDALKELKELMVDFSSLEVITCTGKVSNILAPADGDKPREINWASLLGKAASADIELVAASRFAIDGDIKHFQTSEQLTQLNELLAQHDKYVQLARETRKSLIELFVDAFKLLVPDKKEAPAANAAKR